MPPGRLSPRTTSSPACALEVGRRNRPPAVWFEGTAHVADALEQRNGPGDATAAAQLLTDVQTSQTTGPNNDGLGIIAASKDGLSDCGGDSYYASLHTGATAWYLLAAQRVNPFAP